MKILDNSEKHVQPLLPVIIAEKLNKTITGCKLIGGGSFGRVYKVQLSDGQTIAVKAYRIQGSQETEAEQLRILSENTNVKMPQVMFTFADSETALLAMSFVNGQNVLNPLFLLKNKAQKQKFAEDVIAGMLCWHRLQNDKFGALASPVYDSWYDYYQTEKQIPWLAALQDLTDKGKFSKKKMQLLTDATELFNALPKEDSPAVLIHGDLNIMNIMADPKTLQLNAFIDPFGSMWADREYDLFQLRNMWGDAFGLYETYKKKYPLSEYADFRVAYYASMHEASMRLNGGLHTPLWEDMNNARLKKEMRKLKEKRI